MGGKWRSAPRYPQPRYQTIIEPFAGSAGYSLRYVDRDVILIDKDEIIAGTWHYLVNVREDEIRWSFRQIEKLLHSFHISAPAEASAAHCNERLAHVIAGARGIF